MSLKFGSIFNDIGAGFAKSVESAGQQFKDSFSSADSSSVEFATRRLKLLSEAARIAGETVKDYEEDLKSATRDYGVHSAAYSLALDNLTRAQDHAAKIAEREAIVKEQLNEKTEDLIDTQIRGVGSASKYKQSLSDVNSQFEKDVKKLTEAFKKGKKTPQEYADAIGKLKTDKLKNQMKSVAGSITEGPKVAMEGLGSVMEDTITRAFPQLAIPIQMVTVVAKAAVKQMFELNDSIVNLQRQTGGFVTASKLGYDAFGNSTEGLESLKTATINANISVEEFGESLKSLVDDSFGSTLGGVRIAAEELQKFGVDAAQMKKYYGADIGPTVRRLYQDYGMSVKNSTKFVGDASKKALAMGLNVAGFIKNLSAVTDLIGEVYFSTTDEMKKMATIASQLGVSVGSLSKGLTKMEGITDLFQQQQLTANLGLRNQAQALGEVYALRAQGKTGEADKKEFAALAKDISQIGGVDKTGTITSQGIATLKGAGLEQEQINALQKLTRNAITAGRSIYDLGDITKMTAEEQRRVNMINQNNMTATERLSQSWEKLKQAVIDPMAVILTPVLDAFSLLADSIVGFVNMFIDLGLRLDRWWENSWFGNNDARKIANLDYQIAKIEYEADLRDARRRNIEIDDWETHAEKMGLKQVEVEDITSELTKSLDKTGKSMEELNDSIPKSKGRGLDIDWNKVLEISDADMKKLLTSPTPNAPSAAAQIKANTVTNKTVNANTVNNTTSSTAQVTPASKPMILNQSIEVNGLVSNTSSYKSVV